MFRPQFTLLLTALAILVAVATADGKPPTIVTALNGLDPVLLIDGREVPGEVDRAVVHGRYRYLFASDASRDRFEKSPDKFAIQMDGACARMGPLSGSGSPNRFLVHNGGIYLFASDQCRNTFQSAPDRFLDRPDDAPTGTDAQRARGAELIESALAGFGGADKIDALKTYRLETRISYQQGEQTTTGTAVLTVDFSGPVCSEQVWGEDRYADVIGRDGAFQVQGSEWWPVSEASASYLRRSIYRSPLVALRLRRQLGFTAYAAGTGKVGDTAVEYVQVGLGGATTTWGIDPATGRILQVRHLRRYASLAELERVFSDFRDAGGFIVPHTVTESLDGKVITTPSKTIQSIAFNGPVEEKLFRAPE
jgi:YHS domain-containing protein